MSIDLAGQTFGYLKVLGKAKSRKTKSGKAKARWLCRCTLCGNTVVVDAQNLKRGITKSCGCLAAHKGKQKRNTKICVICGKSFESPPSDKVVTCSKECRKINAKKRGGFTPEMREKISKSKTGKPNPNQPAATAAALLSPLSGPFITNKDAIDWHLIAPDGQVFICHNLSLWVRENCEKYFGCQPGTRESHNVTSGLRNAKYAAKGGTYKCITYKGWRVIPAKQSKGDETR